MIQRKNAGFTLIELLVVIAIIGLLASIVMVSLNSARGKARDAGRLATLRQLQNALEFYANDNSGSYPSTGNSWYARCTEMGAKSLTGSGGYIPNLAPQYIPVLPADQNWTGLGSCADYIYNSNGTDYMILAYYTVETHPTLATNPAPRPLADGLASTCSASTNHGYQPDFAKYTAGASCW